MGLSDRLKELEGKFGTGEQKMTLVSVQVRGEAPTQEETERGFQHLQDYHPSPENPAVYILTPGDFRDGKFVCARCLGHPPGGVNNDLRAQS